MAVVFHHRGGVPVIIFSVHHRGIASADGIVYLKAHSESKLGTQEIVFHNPFCGKTLGEHTFCVAAAFRGTCPYTQFYEPGRFIYGLAKNGNGCAGQHYRQN